MTEVPHNAGERPTAIAIKEAQHEYHTRRYFRAIGEWNTARVLSEEQQESLARFLAEKGRG
tara:strand:- start:1036 stop:1218 length:183 start_codon:yes stop_codon:yes gene_type:complete